MSEHVYKSIELTGSSSASSDEAVRNALAKASKTIRGMRRFQVLECRGHIERDRIDQAFRSLLLKRDPTTYAAQRSPGLELNLVTLHKVSFPAKKIA
jgi:dodecin